MKFLTAEWRDLIMVNYEVDPSILASRVPFGTGLDLHDGRCFVSLVGFMFLNTRMMGIPIPGHVNFEEVNLRFYVKRQVGDETRRGVCFVKEIVPRRAIAFIARTLYGEPYERCSMNSSRSADRVEYGWLRGDRVNSIAVDVGGNQGIPAEGSHGEFIIEHYWGYTKRANGRTDEYRVQHPKWELRHVISSKIDVDFGAVYGNEFAFLAERSPTSVVFAEGSEIAVYFGVRS